MMIPTRLQASKNAVGDGLGPGHRDKLLPLQLTVTAVTNCVEILLKTNYMYRVPGS